MSSHTRHHTHLLSFKSHLQLACIEITHLSVTCWSRALLHVSIQLCLSTVDLHFNQAPIHEMESKNDTHGLLICFWTKHFEKILQKHLNFITPIISLQGHRVKLQPKVPSKLRQRNLKTQLYYLWLGLPSTLICHENRAFNFKKALQTRGIQKHSFRFHVDKNILKMELFKNRWWHHYNHMISLTKFSSNTNQTDQWLLPFQTFRFSVDGAW